MARVFKLKLDELIRLIDKERIFGKVAARIHVVEFQKRGLPHVHILLILEEKIVNVDQVDGFVCAEIPQDNEMCLKFDAHINVEVCSSTKACKYLFKYIHKGGDRAMVRTDAAGVQEARARDEIDEYHDARSIGACEAAWRLFGFPLADCVPNVVALPCHLENGQRVQFEEGQARALLEGEPPVTMLTAWLALNKATPAGAEPPPRYIDMPKTHVFKANAWRPRKTNTTAVGRLHWVHPSVGEAFYLRILLAREEMRGAKDFKAMRTVDGDERESYKAACAALGLLQDDDEWDGMMTEAARSQMGKSLRALFVYIVLNCQETLTVWFFDSHAVSMSDDFARDVARARRTLASDDDARLARSLLLLEIERMLPTHDAAGEEAPARASQERRDALEFLEQVGAPRVIAEETYDRVRGSARRRSSVSLPSQRSVDDSVISAVREGRQDISFWDAPAGTGKTFCANAVLSAVRGMGKHALAVASSGIAAVLLGGGRTFHSRFKAPLSMGRESPPFHVKRQSALAGLIRRADLSCGTRRR